MRARDAATAMLTVWTLSVACTAPSGFGGDDSGTDVGWESGVVSWSAISYPGGTQQFVTWQVFGETDRVSFGEGFMVDASDEAVRDGLTSLNDRSPFTGDLPSGEYLAYEVVARLGVKGWELVDVEYGTYLVVDENTPLAAIRWYLKRRITS